MKKLVAAMFAFTCLLLPSKGTLANVTPETAQGNQPSAVLDQKNPQIHHVIDVQDRHTRELMSIKGVVGTAAGVNDAGRPAVIVYTSATPEPGSIPQSLEGVPVDVKATGPFEIEKTVKSTKFSTTAILPLPLPIGVSTGNVGQCESGTISARVKDSGGNYYALSNNHVYALENSAPVGSEITQPGLYDTQCQLNGNNDIGALSRFVTINFSGGNNTVDAAIALTSTSELGNSTPPNGYGTPGSTTASPAIGMAVQKYGRSTQLTKGAVSAINANVIVDYGSGESATFVNQIIIGTKKPFIKAGDSGSLLVTDNTAANPVGLIFAGNSSGNYSIANPIADVLSDLGVTIDGK